MSDIVKLDMDGPVATITLNRPERLNALSPRLFDAWNAALDAALAGGAKAIVLTGEGRAFCAGADLQPDGMDQLDPDLGVTIDGYYNPMMRRLAGLDVPVVTAINGPAVGAGMGFALAGDIVVMAESAYLLLAFVNIALVPDAGCTWLVARSVGRARAMELALLGEQIDAQAALGMGLVNRVVADAEVLSAAQALAARLAQGPTRTIGLIRQQITYALDHDLDAVLDRERANQRKAGFTSDFAEAVRAFGEKRPPKFKGE